jgi:AsmA protein
MLKKTLIALGVVLGVFVLGLVALALFFDANKYKPEIEQYVHDNYKRTLKFDGDLSLSVFPRIALALPATTLSNLGGDRVSASLKSAKVSVALLPLFHSRLEVGTVSIDGLTATVERRRDGTTSIDDLLKRDGAAAQPNQPSTSKGTPDFEVGGIELTDADLTLHDLDSKRTVHLSQLSLKTGRLAPVVRTPLQFETLFDVSAPQATGQVRVASTLDLDLGKTNLAASGLDATVKAMLDKQPMEIVVLADRAAYTGASGGIEAIKVDAKAKGKWDNLTLDESRLLAPALVFDPKNKRITVGGLEANAKGKSNADAFEATLSAPKLEVTEAAAAGQRVILSAKYAPSAANVPAGQVHLTLEGVSGSARQIDIAKVALNAEGSQGARKFAAALSGALMASLEAQTLSLPRFEGDITMDDPALPQRTVKVPLTARLAVDAKAEKADAGFASRFDETNAAAEFNVRGFSAPRITFEASADRLNVDRYFPPPPPAPGNDSADPKEDPKVDLSALRNLDLSGSVKVGSLQARGLKATNVDVGVKAANGRLDVAPLNAQLYGGALVGTANLIAENNRVKVDTVLSNVAIQPLLKDMFDRDLIEGRGNVRLDVTTAGATVGGMKKHLGGSASLKLRDGAIKGINLAAKLRDAKNLLAGAKDDTTRANPAEKTDFSELNATFAIKDGVAVNEDLDMKSPLLRVGGGGKVDIGAGSMDYTTRVSVVGTLKGQDGRTVDQLRGVTVPVKVSGPLDRLAWNIDWNVAAQEALKSQVTQKLTPQIQAEKDKARANVEQKARDALKGLLQK